ncbi:phage holin family protein [Pseudomonas hefeiensis]|uniref:Phage holin family protein n=1 Tax=Pseudomonas hefeiensis TaxID=2738125 RepID=A0ABY9GG72_9PSED|nr:MULTISPECIES: phage holin family protein [unclassified Pseudomonas]WLH14645.1 phage holin family protein [Pseudomonas sp. FP205]WLH97701.1 phage holin family protein [Pseudomonas sp. FP53]WLI41974.1 phage holin family protein [Pseudomonas sp. FP821]
MNRPDPDIQRPVGTSMPDNDASVVGLLKQLTHEVPSLFTKELALAKAEFQASLNTLKAGIAGVAGGAIVLLAGFIILLMAVVYGLSTIMQPWLAALIVGGVVMIIGFIMVQSGKKQFEPSHFKPDRTLDALNKDQQALRRKVS